MTAILDRTPMLQGRYTLLRLKKKPENVLLKEWLRRIRAGQAEHAVLSRTEHKNLVVFNTDHGVHLVLKQLGGDYTFPLGLDNASIGTGSTTPTAADTDLQTPVLTDIPLATVEVGSNYVFTEWFMSDDQLANGTYNEFGLKCGTQLFCRSIISPAHTKGAGEDTLIQYTIEADNTP